MRRINYLALNINADVRGRFPELQVLTFLVKGVMVKRRSTELQKLCDEIVKQVKKKYDLESLKDLPTFKAYRNFFWRVGIDPTKNRPAAEALVRRVLRGRSIPQINSFVDAYNLASIKTEIAFAAFDAHKLKGALVMRLAKRGEFFLGIGMQKPFELDGGEVVISDAEKLLAIYPHRDADQAKITDGTKTALMLVCGVPDIGEETLLNAAQLVINYVTRFCNGEVVFDSHSENNNVVKSEVYV